MAPPRPRFKTLSETYVKPASVEHASDEAALHGVDVMIGHLQVRLVYYFEELLPVEALKASLSEALVSFPLFSGRTRVSRGRHSVQLNGAGALVREQKVTFYGHDEGLDSPSLRPYLDGFAGPERYGKAHGGHLLTITFTEICHAESFYACAPAACKGGLDSSQAEDWTGKRPIKYALGVSASHGVADGSSVAQFLLNWALVSCGGKRLPLAPFQRAAISPPAQEGSTSSPATPPKDYVQVGLMGRVSIVASALWSEYTYTNASLYFSDAELEAIKAKCMAPLAGSDLWVTTSNSLAAHCWPLISSLMMGHDDTKKKSPAAEEALCPMIIIFNARKQLGLPLNFFGNLASFSAVDPSTADEEVTALALKIRKAASTSEGDRLKAEFQFVHNCYEKGDVHGWIHRVMRDGMVGGKPYVGWDDVSGFQPPVSNKNGSSSTTTTTTTTTSSTSSAGGVAFAGARPVVIDFSPSMWFPGMTFVLPAPHGNKTGGKEVMICLTRKQAKTLMTPEWQERIHCYKPEDEQLPPVVDTTTAAAGEEAAAEQVVVVEEEEAAPKPDENLPISTGEETKVGEETKPGQ